jgi:hypothetical protein
MNLLRHIACTAALLTALPASAAPPQPGTEDACIAMNDKSCDVIDVHVFSAVDLNADAEKEIIFAWSGGSCGEQHWIFTRRKGKWEQIGNWCGVDGGAYSVLRSKHNGFRDIDTHFGVLRFTGKEYPDTTKK